VNSNNLERRGKLPAQIGTQTRKKRCKEKPDAKKKRKSSEDENQMQAVKTETKWKPDADT